MNGQQLDRATGTRNDRRRRGRAGVGMLMVGALTSSGLAAVLTASTAVAAAPVFPNNIVVFPNRDFVTVEGYADHVGETATLTVTRPGAGVIGSAQAVVAAGDVAFEVNHPGGMCWGAGTNVKVTPDIQPGDVVGISFGGVSAGETTTQGGYVTGESVLSGTTLTVTGHVDAGMNQAQTEQRIIEPALKDTVVARRDIRALPGPIVPSDKGGYSSGMVFDGDTFTATYEFNDLATAQIAAAATGARLMAWQVADVLGNRQGLTIAEYGELGGPGMGGCPNGPLQSGPAGPTDVVAANVSGGVKLTWKPAVAVPGTPAITGYRATAVAKTESGIGERVEIGRRISNAAATGTTITGLASGEIYDIEVVSVSSVGLTLPAVGAIPVTDITAPIASASPDAGSFRVAQQVTLSADQAGSEIYFTTNGSSPITNGQPSLGATLYTAPIAISATTTLNFVAFDPSGNLSTTVERLFTITDTPVPAAPTSTGASEGGSSVTLNWASAVDASITGYGVQVYDAAGTTKVGTLLTPAPATAKTMTISAGLTSDTPYKFTVVANNANGSSPELWFGPLTPQGAAVASAGPDQTVVRKTTAQTVNLTGAGSTTAGATYAWSQVVANPSDNVTLTSPTTSSTSFSLPVFTHGETNNPMTFRLTVTVGGVSKTDEILVTPQADQVQIGGARWKSGDFRVDGVGSVVGSTITVRQGTKDGRVLGTAPMTAAAAPATGGVFNLRLRNAAANPNPRTVWIESNLGGSAGPFTIG